MPTTNEVQEAVAIVKKNPRKRPTKQSSIMFSGLLCFARNDLSKVTSGEIKGAEHVRKLIFLNFLITFYLEILKNYV